MSALHTDSVLQELINQFSDPMAFLRELIQNAIDAGSQEVFVRTEYVDGVFKIFVEDFGEGMTRDIIENKLTRLFSSTKEDDLTQIGRFGIGFVSVFAIEPELVVLDTGRAGEYWRVLFHPNRSYELIRLQHPVEGTQIQLLKRVDAKAAKEMEARVREVTKAWCRHVAVPIYFDSEDIRDPFDVPSLVKVTYEEEGTRLVAGYDADEYSPPAGFYNRGLTLSETPSRVPFVTFKIDSRYLEHTLTRDQILEDKHFHKVQAILRDVEKKQLPAQLFARLEAFARAPESSPQGIKDYQSLAKILTNLSRTFRDFWDKWDDREIFPTRGGQPLSFSQVQKLWRRGRVYFTHGSTHMNEYMEKVELLLYPELFRGLFEFRNIPVAALESAYVLPRPLAHTPAPFAALSGVLARLYPSTEFRLESFDYPGSAVASEVAIGFKKLVPMEYAEFKKNHAAMPMESKICVLNLASKVVQDSLSRAETAPEWAAYLLVKYLGVPRGWTIKADNDLLLACTLRRTGG